MDNGRTRFRNFRFVLHGPIITAVSSGKTFVKMIVVMLFNWIGCVVLSVSLEHGARKGRTSLLIRYGWLVNTLIAVTYVVYSEPSLEGVAVLFLPALYFAIITIVIRLN